MQDSNPTLTFDHKKGANMVETMSQSVADSGAHRNDGFETSESTMLPSPQQDARALGDVVERFRSLHPADWEQLRLCPLQHGLETMVRKLRAFR